MNNTNLQQWIQHPELLNRDTLYELRTLVSRYPYFQTVRLLYLKNLFLLHDAAFGAELRKAVLFVPDRRVLFYLIEGDRFRLHPVKQSAIFDDFTEEPSVDRTLSLIDAFLATVPDELTQEINYTGMTVSYSLEAEHKETAAPEASKLRGQELIDGFIEKQAADVPAILPYPTLEEAYQTPEEETWQAPADGPVTGYGEEEEESYFTETLAKIYTKQGRYAKALEIIRKLSLKYPKKNAYFADQIRFLEKLIINEKSK